MSTYVRGFRVLRRRKSDKGVERFDKIGRVYHVRESAERLCSMMNANAKALGDEADYYVQDVVGADPVEAQ